MQQQLRPAAGSKQCENTKRQANATKAHTSSQGQSGRPGQTHQPVKPLRLSPGQTPAVAAVAPQVAEPDIIGTTCCHFCVVVSAVVAVAVVERLLVAVMVRDQRRG